MKYEKKNQLILTIFTSLKGDRMKSIPLLFVVLLVVRRVGGGGSRGSNEPPLVVNNGGLKRKTAGF